MRLRQLVLTIHHADGDKEWKTFPYDLDAPGAKEAAEERMELFRAGLELGARTSWTVRQVREMVTA